MPARVFVVCTGAGAGAQADLWRTPGCSEYLAGAAFPYASDQLQEFLGFRPERASSPDTALELAMAAYQRAWLPGGSAAIGIGVTAVVASTAVHRGEHRIHAAAMTREGVWGVDVVLDKASGKVARQLDGERADALVAGLLAGARGQAPWSAVGAQDRSTRARALFFERPLFDEAGERTPLGALGPGALFPGAFNPPHAGHLGAALASGEPVIFAISADPPHKPALALCDLLERAKALHGRRRMFTVGDALYLEKARRFPGRAMLIGADALERMLDERWGAPVMPMLRELALLGTRFLVFGRAVEGTYLTARAVLEAARVPAELQSIFREIPGRWDTSSSEIRQTL
jgi:nicotinic acid mononucleotide adenylyltransferase